MGKINSVKCLELLNTLHTITLLCHELSKNNELTELLEKMRDLLERMITTIENRIG